MRTTIKTADAAVIVEPSIGGEVLLTIKVSTVVVNAFLTQDQAGALIFAIEQAAEAADLKRQRDQAAG